MKLWLRWIVVLAMLLWWSLANAQPYSAPMVVDAAGRKVGPLLGVTVFDSNVVLIKLSGIWVRVTVTIDGFDGNDDTAAVWYGSSDCSGTGFIEEAPPRQLFSGSLVQAGVLYFGNPASDPISLSCALSIRSSAGCQTLSGCEAPADIVPPSNR